MRPAPPFAWIDDLVRQARDAGVKVYFKSNLFDDRGHRRLRPQISLGAECVRRHLRLAFGAQGLRA
jgi:hypothetical protein